MQWETLTMELQTLDSLVTKYATPDESVDDFVARVGKLLDRQATPRAINTAEEAEQDKIPVRDYRMPPGYEPRQIRWPSFRAEAIFADGVFVRGTVMSDPRRGVNAGHAIRVLAAFYRNTKEVYERYGFDASSKAIPVPPIVVMTINGNAMADMDEVNRLLVTTVKYDPNDIAYGPKYFAFMGEKARESSSTRCNPEEVFDGIPASDAAA
jgi:hypothetical protein